MRPDFTNQLNETLSLHRERKTRETQFNRIAEKAREKPEETFTSLAHYLTEEYLLESFKKLRKTAAKGLDGVGWYDYSKNLASNIASLHKRLRDKT